MKVEFRRSFVKDLEKITDQRLKQRVRDVILAVEEASALSDVGHVRKLRAGDNYYRIRVGDYRNGLLRGPDGLQPPLVPRPGHRENGQGGGGGPPRLECHPALGRGHFDRIRRQKTMRRTTLTWLVPLVALLALIAASAGLFAPGGDGPFTFPTVRGQTVEMYGVGLYQNDTRFAGAGFRGADAALLIIGLPLLMACYLRYRRGGVNAALIMS